MTTDLALLSADIAFTATMPTDETRRSSACTTSGKRTNPERSAAEIWALACDMEAPRIIAAIISAEMDSKRSAPWYAIIDQRTKELNESSVKAKGKQNREDGRTYATGTVSDIIADEVSNDGRITRVIFWQVFLNLSTEIGADICSLGVDAARQLRKECHEGRAKTKAS